MVLQLMHFEITSDGAIVRGQHSVTYFIIRCLDAPPELVSTKRNVKLLLCIPGPRGPKDNGVYWNIVLRLSEHYSSAGLIHAPTPLTWCLLT